MGLILFLMAGALVGATISGFLGMAGGTTLLALMLLTPLSPTIIVPIHAAVQLASNATRVYAHLEHVRWGPFLLLAVFALPGPLLGLELLKHLETHTIRGLMGVAILYAAWVPKWGVEQLPDRVAFSIAGVLGGVLGVVVGAVGPLIAPFFLRGSFTKHSIIATKAVCQAYLHLLKIVAFTSVGFGFLEHLDITLPMVGAVIVGTYMGKWILSRLSEERFVLAYRVVLSILAIRLVWQAWMPALVS